MLRAQVSEAVWFSTFQDVSALESDPSMLRVSAPNGHTRDRIMSRYLPLVRDALEEIGAANRQFVVEVQVAEPALNEFVEQLPDTTTEPINSSGRSGMLSPVATGGMNPRYTFETFVKGASNQFALAAALRVAETPGRSYNPLFIYGAAGLGKTHLLHAIGHYVHRHYQHDVVRYVSTETFLNEYVDGIRTNTIANFKRRYRDIDVLLIDDIQFMEGKEGLQEEFFHTFNSLHGANKQIVISSDRMPDAIPTLEERLRGRFKWGLITDIQPPDLETRLAILRNKAERDHSPVPAETLEFIASRITTNIRELEGALIRVTAYASLNNVPISTHLAEQLLSDLLTETLRQAAHRRRAAQRDRRSSSASASTRSAARAASGRSSPPARWRCTCSASSPISAIRHRPAVRRPRPHHRDPRRRQDPAADEGAQADLRPGHRSRPAIEEGVAVHVVWTTSPRTGDNTTAVHRTTNV